MITKGDNYHKIVLKKIFKEGSTDINPRPHWADGTPAHTKSINHVIQSYDLAAGDCPFITLRPIAIKKAIGEILWIYQDQSSDLNLLRDKYGVTWWDEWDIGDRSIGQCYGATVRDHDLINKLLNGLISNPDGRRHIISLWQDEDFETTHGLKPCCYQTIWNVRHGEEYDYLDMMMVQRSSDYITSCTINELQYIALMEMVCGHLNTHRKKDSKAYMLGRFTHVIVNAQIYDRHEEAARELIERVPYQYEDKSEMPQFAVASKDFYQYTVEDFRIMNSIQDWAKENNPQVSLEVAI